MTDSEAGGVEPVYLTLENVLDLYALIVGTTRAAAVDQYVTARALRRDRAP